MVSGGAGPRIRTLIVIDVRLYREGLAATLRTQEGPPGGRHGGAARTDAMSRGAELKPDLVIVDVAMPKPWN